MGRRSKKGGKRRDVEDNDDASVASSNDIDTTDAQLDEEKLEDLVELLSEKSKDTRVRAFTRIGTELALKFDAEFLEGRTDTLCGYISAALRKGTSSEVAAACRLLSIIVVTIGPTAAEPVHAQFSPALQKMVKDTSKHLASRAAAAKALAFTCFVGAGEDDDTPQLLSTFESLFSAKPRGSSSSTSASASAAGDDFKVACVDSWNLLASTRPSMELAKVHFTALLPALFALLEHSSLEVRTAAGESIALLYEARLAVDVDSDDDEDTDGSADANDEEKTGVAASGKRLRRRRRSSSRAVASVNVDEDDLVARLKQLSTDSSKRRAKKDRAKQRAAFRHVVATVEDGSLPSETLTLGLGDIKEKRTLSGWTQLLRLEALRELLGTGLQHHFVNNGIISDILVVDGVDALAKPMTRRQRSEEKKVIIEQSKIKARASAERNEKGRLRKVAHLAAANDE